MKKRGLLPCTDKVPMKCNFRLHKFLYLENIAYDPLIGNFPILAAYQGEKIFFSKSKVAPK